MTFRACRLALSVVSVTVGLAATAGAQTNDEIFPNLEWNFSTPGARANGMGRTFIGIADDATAAITNPAGLVSLTRPQVYLEYKNTRLKVDRLAAANSFVTLQPTTFESTINALSFLSVSAPLGDRIAVGFSLHRFLDHDETFSLAPRAIPNSAAGFALFPVTGSAKFTGTSFGGSIAYRVTEGFRVGATIAGNRLESDTVATRNRIIFGPGSNLSASNIIENQTSIQGSQTAISASFGALYRTEMLSIGFSYEKSPRFNTVENALINPGVNTNLPLVVAVGFPKAVAIDVPDHFGIGLSVRPTSRLLVGADVVRMQYSSLSKNTTIIFESTGVTSGSFTTRDVSEVHVGAEYNLFNLQGQNPVFVRAGLFTNPHHLPTFSGVPTEDNANERAKYNLLPRKDDTRGTVGAGVAFGTRLQVDAAYVVGKEFVASTAVRF